MCVALDPGARLRDIVASLDITERRAYGIVTDLTEAGYVLKTKDGRRNRYEIQAHLPLPESTGRERCHRRLAGPLGGKRRHLDARARCARRLTSVQADISGELPGIRSRPLAEDSRRPAISALRGRRGGPLLEGERVGYWISNGRLTWRRRSHWVGSSRFQPSPYW